MGMGGHMTYDGGMVPNNTKGKNAKHTSYNPSNMPKIIKWHGVLKPYKANSKQWW